MFDDHPPTVPVPERLLGVISNPDRIAAEKLGNRLQGLPIPSNQRHASELSKAASSSIARALGGRSSSPTVPIVGRHYR